MKPTTDAAPPVAAPPAAALALVPGLESGSPPLRLEKLLGGTVNDSWRVDTSAGRFVLRIDAPAALRPGVDRDRERRLHGAAAGAGLAPRVLGWAGAAGVQVREYLEGRVWSDDDMSRPGQLARLGGRLAQLHALEVPAGVEAFDPGASAQQYLWLMEVGAAAARGAGAVAAEVRAAAMQVAAHAVQPAIVHGDLTHTNLLDGAGLWLLDWEYAQCADPVYDVACVLAYSPAARPQAVRLLEAAGIGGPGAAARLGAAVRVYEGLTWLWHLARATGVRASRSAN